MSLTQKGMATVSSPKIDQSRIAWMEGSIISLESCRETVANITLLAYPKTDAQYTLIVNLYETSILVLFYSNCTTKLCNCYNLAQEN
ncbi:hypothetical protein NPIL_45691 [Nephila pilipes]|uniref:Uncharacterized protein n=1 Tax=Nephila pilipes TaxID=299642 RepID=A0A8X6QVQ4_NEPPI|nr:hypothetical protein NPIL_45691 [Nephila pilipes]